MENIENKQEVVLYGYVYNEYTKSEECVELAIFDTVERAKLFAESKRLKHPRCTDWQGAHVFRKDSLLGPYDDYEIETYVPEYLPRNPE